MGDFTRQLSEILALVSVTDPQAFGTGTSTDAGDAIDMRLFRRVIFTVAVGALGSGSTVDFKLQGLDLTGPTLVDIPGKAITQLTEAGSDDNKQAIIEITAEEAATLGYRYIAGLLTVVGAATGNYVAVLAQAGVARYDPASEFDLASVDEIVT